MEQEISDLEDLLGSFTGEVAVCTEKNSENGLMEPGMSESGCSRLDSKKPCARWGASLTAIGSGQFVLHGGQSKDVGEMLGDVHVFSLKSKNWTTPTACVNTAVAWHTATFLPHTMHIVVYGGVNESGELDACNVFDCEINLWYPLQTNGKKPGKRMGHSATLLGGKRLCIFGGREKGEDYNDLHTLDVENWRWTRQRPTGTPPKPRAFHKAAAIAQNKMAIVAGNLEDRKSLDDVHILTTDDSFTTFEWSSPILTGALFRPRYGHQVVAMSDAKKILVFGGWDSTAIEEEIFGDALILDIENSHWKAAQDEGIDMSEIGPVSGHSAAVDKESGLLVVFGGQTSLEAGDQIAETLHIVPLNGGDTASALENKQPILLRQQSVTTPTKDSQKLAKASTAEKRRFSQKSVSVKRFRAKTPVTLDMAAIVGR